MTFWLYFIFLAVSWLKSEWGVVIGFNQRGYIWQDGRLGLALFSWWPIWGFCLVGVLTKHKIGQVVPRFAWTCETSDDPSNENFIYDDVQGIWATEEGVGCHRRERKTIDFIDSIVTLWMSWSEIQHVCVVSQICPDRYCSDRNKLWCEGPRLKPSKRHFVLWNSYQKIWGLEHHTKCNQVLEWRKDKYRVRVRIPNYCNPCSLSFFTNTTSSYIRKWPPSTPSPLTCPLLRPRRPARALYLVSLLLVYISKTLGQTASGAKTHLSKFCPWCPRREVLKR